MTNEDRFPQLSKRQFLGLIGASTGMAGVLAELAPDDGQGSLSGGTLALSEPYNVADTKLWIGPDSAKGQVDAKSGRIYVGSSGDGYTIYNGDAGSWVKKGLGDSSNAIPSATIDDTTHNNSIEYPDGTTITTSPNISGGLISIPASELTNGAAIWAKVPVPDGVTLTVKSWGVSTDQNTTPSGLKAQLTKPDTAVIAEQSTAYAEDPSGATATASGFTRYRARVKNDTGSNINSNNTPSAVTGWFEVRRD